jgi:hypothetical protein
MLRAPEQRGRMRGGAPPGRELTTASSGSEITGCALKRFAVGSRNSSPWSSDMLSNAGSQWEALAHNQAARSRFLRGDAQNEQRGVVVPVATAEFASGC